LSTVTDSESRSGRSKFGPDVDLRGERQLLAVLEPGDLKIGLAHRDDVVLRHCLVVELGHSLVDRLLENGPAADARGR
jgi:hypothetical protein